MLMGKRTDDGRQHMGIQYMDVLLCHVYACTSIMIKGNKNWGVTFVIMASFLLLCVLLGDARWLVWSRVVISVSLFLLLGIMTLGDGQGKNTFDAQLMNGLTD